MVESPPGTLAEEGKVKLTPCPYSGRKQVAIEYHSQWRVGRGDATVSGCAAGMGYMTWERGRGRDQTISHCGASERGREGGRKEATHIENLSVRMRGRDIECVREVIPQGEGQCKMGDGDTIKRNRGKKWKGKKTTDTCEARVKIVASRLS